MTAPLVRPAVRRFVRPLVREVACCAAAVVVLLAADVAFGCPNCKEGVAENDPNATRLAAGFYYSILFMLSMPVIVFTTFVSVCYRAVRKARGEQEAG